jgi:hypothetical protein
MSEDQLEQAWSFKEPRRKGETVYQHLIREYIDNVADQIAEIIDEPLTPAQRQKEVNEFLIGFLTILGRDGSISLQTMKKVESLLNGYTFEELLHHLKNAVADPEISPEKRELNKLLGIFLIRKPPTPTKRLQPAPQKLDFSVYSRTPAQMREMYPPTGKPFPRETIYKQALREFINRAAADSNELLQGGHASPQWRYEAAFNSLLEYFSIAARDPKNTEVALYAIQELPKGNWNAMSSLTQSVLNRKKPVLPYEKDIFRVVEYLLTHRFEEDYRMFKK